MPNDVADTVKIVPINAPDELYHKYPRESEAQPCVLILNLKTGVLTASYKGEISGTPMDVFHGHTIWTGIPCLTATAANKLLEQAKPLAERILAGSDIEWDGNNMVGRQNGDATAALTALEALCDSENFETGDLVEGIDAGDYYSGISSIEAIDQFELTADTTDDELAEKALKAEQEAAEGGEAGYAVLSCVEVYLTGLREDLRQDKRHELEQIAERIEDETEKFTETIRPLRDGRDNLIREIKAWGVDSDRAVGDLVGLSHTTIGNIVKAAQNS